MLDEAKGVCDKNVVKDCQLTYDIMLGNRHDCIEEMEALLDRADPPLRAKLYKLIAKQYRNAGNKKQAQYYDGLLVQLIKENSMPEPPKVAQAKREAAAQGSDAPADSGQPDTEHDAAETPEADA